MVNYVTNNGKLSLLTMLTLNNAKLSLLTMLNYRY